MLISNQRIADAVIDTILRLQKRSGLPIDVAYDLGVVATVLRHAQHVDVSDGADIREYCRQTLTLMDALRANGDFAAINSPAIGVPLDDVDDSARRLVASPQQGDALKQRFIEFLGLMDRTLGLISTTAPKAAVSIYAALTPLLLHQHNGMKLFGTSPLLREAEVSPGEPLTEANLTAYLQDKLNDPSAAATGVTTLPGGFGKETTLFGVESKTLHGEFVMRRDAPINIFGDLDCHVAPREFPLLKAVFERGFPAPEPVMFEASTPCIAGPAFTIMRRAPGAVVGDVIGGEGKVLPEQQRTLAQITARLHAVAPLKALSAIPSFDPSLWDKTASECTRTYIHAWYQHFLTASHLPMPVLHGLFNWLLDNVPENDAAPVLVHGDIGFHNLLFSAADLSAVLDWEYAHVGDPAEDLGYIRGGMGNQLDWPAFMAEYAKYGHVVPEEKRLKFFEIWSLVRNSAGSVLVMDNFDAGRYRNIKYCMTIYRYAPYFIEQAETLIRNFHQP